MASKIRQRRPVKKTLKQQYQSRIKALQKQLRKYEERGFYVNLDDVKISKSISLADTPERVTRKQLERVKSLKPKQIIKQYGFYVSEVTYGEEVSAQEGFKFEREYKKQAEDARARYYDNSDRDYADEGVPWTNMLARAYILDYYSLVDKYKSGPLFKRRVEELITMAMNDKDAGDTDEERRNYAEIKIAQMLDEGAKHGLIVNYDIAYDEAKMQNYWTQMINYLQVPPSQMDDIMEAIEQGEIFRDYDNGNY